MLLEFDQDNRPVIQSIIIDSPGVVIRTRLVVPVKIAQDPFQLMHDASLGSIEGREVAEHGQDHRRLSCGQNAIVIGIPGSHRQDQDQGKEGKL